MAQQQGGRRPSEANRNHRRSGEQRSQQAAQYRRVQNSAGTESQSAVTGGLTPEQKKARLRRKQELLRRRRRHRRNLIGIALLLVIAVSFVGIKMLNGTWGEPTDDGLDELDMEELDDEAEEKLYDGPPVARIAFVGDISTSADQVRAVTRPDGTYDFTIPFADVAKYFTPDQVAYAVGDFETTMVDGLAYGGEPYYNSPVQLAGTLRGLGFRLMSTANTYALNNGIEGLTSTKNYLTEAKLRSVGTYLSQAERDKNNGAYIRNIHKIKFAFLAYTKGTDSVTMPAGCEYALNTLYSDYADYWSELRSSQIRRDVQAAKDAGAEVIVALVHWGSEYSRSVSEPQKEVADLLLKNGVDVIIGTHSHLVNEMGFQEVELSDGSVKQCFVAYGLGDFYTDPADAKAQQSLILNLEFSRSDDGRVSITDAGYVPIYMHITEDKGIRRFQVLDVYKNLADLKRKENLTSSQAELFNQLLDTVDTMHNYGGEDLDQGPADEDRRIVEKALEGGEIPSSEIKALRKAEKKAEEAARKEAEEKAAEEKAAREEREAQETETPEE